MRQTAVLLLTAILLTACSSNKWKAPVESRSGGPNTATKPTVVERASSAPEQAEPVETPEVSSAPAKSTSDSGSSAPVTAAGDSPVSRTYKVNRGDTLYAIARSQGVTVKQLIAWNRLEEPYAIVPGQVLVLNSGTEKVENVTTVSTQTRYSGKQQRDAEASRTPVENSGKQAPAPEKRKTRRVDGLDWQWPVVGKVSQKFSPSDPSRRGIKIAGKSGMQVTAAEDGEVVYSGDGLVGYGQLIIIKHNQQYLSAYGHNRNRLVKEGDRVKRGAVIATMGQLKGRHLLHFEIRRNGKPADPLEYLP
jgi:lipoprotein NlpD